MTDIGRYQAKLATTAAEVESAQRLRQVCFRGDRGPDVDDFDEFCQHVVITDSLSDDPVCCFRLLHLESSADITASYSAQFYDLETLPTFDGSMVEMGRFCIHPNSSDPDILRVAWTAMTRFVEDNEIELLFGCSSFQGTDETAYLDAFALLKERHLAPERWMPRVKAPRVFEYARRLGAKRPDLKQAMKHMPPLLRTYLMMGGWVSDHAVIDHDLQTLHVFTGLEVRSVPAARRRLLKA